MSLSFSEAKKLYEKARRQETPKVLSQICGLMDEYGITVAELSAFIKKGKQLSGERKKRKAASSPSTTDVSKKYLYMKDGIGFTGRGRRPTWVTEIIEAGEDIEQYRIK